MSGKYIRALTIRRFLSLMAIIRFTQHRRKVQLYRKLITFVIPSCKITVKLFGRDSVDWESKGFVTKVKDQVKLLYSRKIIVLKVFKFSILVISTILSGTV